MGLLVGLPLKLFSILFGLLRLAWPVLLVLLVLHVLRRRKVQEVHREPERQKEPEFNGPVYTVDYEEVDSEEQP